MKKLAGKLQFPIWIYKLIGLVLTAAFLVFVHKLYFPAPPVYGDAPFYIVLCVALGLWLLLPRIADKIVATIILIAFAAYYLIQAVYYSQFGQYVNINGMTSQYSDASAYKYLLKSIVTAREWWVFGILLAVIFCLWIIRRKPGSGTRTQTILLLCISLLLCTVPPYFLFDSYLRSLHLVSSDDPDYFELDSYIYDMASPSNLFVQKFGLEQFLFQDLEKNVFHHEDLSETQLAMVKEYLSENTPYETNAYTGRFAGKSLILIQAESLTTMAIDETLTPTLYKLMNEGWYFKNYHSPLMEGSTSTTELMANTSLMPPADGNVPSEVYGTNTYPTTLAKGFQQNGYTADAFHNNYAEYYNRDVFYPSIGYSTFLDSYKLGVPVLESDLTCAKIISWVDVDNKDPFFSFWVTYSGHQDYTVDFSNTDKYGPSCAEEYTAYLDTVKKTYPDLSEEMQVYMAKNMSLDRAIAEYISVFEQQGRDDIVIAIYGDHFAKEFTDEDRRTSAFIFEDEETDDTRSLNHTPLILWTPGIDHQVFDKYCFSMDLLPTLFNLFSIPYDRSSIMGNDIFDDRYPGFYFDIDYFMHGDGWSYSMNDHDYYQEPSSGKAETDAMVKRFIKSTYISDFLFENDYFASDVYRSGS